MRRLSFSKLSFLLLGTCLCLPVVGCGGDAGVIEGAKDAAGEVVDGAKDAAGEVVDDAKAAAGDVVDDVKESVMGSDEKGSDEKE